MAGIDHSFPCWECDLLFSDWKNLERDPFSDYESCSLGWTISNHGHHTWSVHNNRELTFTRNGFIVSV